MKLFLEEEADLNLTNKVSFFQNMKIYVMLTVTVLYCDLNMHA